MRRTIISIFLAAFIAGCASTRTPVAPPVDTGFTIQINQQFDALPNYTRIYFQQGMQLPSKALDRWMTYCRLHVYNPDKKADYMTAVFPGRFTVDRVRNRYEVTENKHDGSDLYASVGFGFSIYYPSSGLYRYRDGPPSYYLYRVEMKLSSPEQPDVQALICSRKWGTSGNYYPTLKEIRLALGDIIEVIPRTTSTSG